MKKFHLKVGIMSFDRQTSFSGRLLHNQLKLQFLQFRSANGSLQVRKNISEEKNMYKLSPAETKTRVNIGTDSTLRFDRKRGF